MKCTLEEFKQMTATFLKELERPGYDDYAIDAGLKCLTLYYLNFQGSPSDEALVLSYYNHALRKYIPYEVGKDLIEPSPNRKVL